MAGYELVAGPDVEADITSSYEWYEREQPGLGRAFLHAIEEVTSQIEAGPFKYQELRSGIRRALAKQFPYAVYFAVEGEVVVVLAVLHASRSPTRWQRRRTT